MPITSRQIRRILAFALDALLIILGFCLFTGIINFGPAPLWAPPILILVGVMLLSDGNQGSGNFRTGALLFVIGILMLLRSANIIELPILSVLLGVTLWAVAGFSIWRELRHSNL